MPSKAIDASGFSPDILEFIRLMEKHKVRYLIVGREASGRPRDLEDLSFLQRKLRKK
jgi:hypothetical protein